MTFSSSFFDSVELCSATDKLIEKRLMNFISNMDLKVAFFLENIQKHLFLFFSTIKALSVPVIHLAPMAVSIVSVIFVVC